MFDIGWSELFVIAVVAVIVVGPKDLPRMLRTFGNWVARMKRMAGDFQGQFNEALREAELADVKKSIEDIGKIDPLADVRSAMDAANQVGNDIQREMQRPIGESATASTTPVADPQPTLDSPAITPTPAHELPAPSQAPAPETHVARPAEAAGSNRP